MNSCVEKNSENYNLCVVEHLSKNKLSALPINYINSDSIYFIGDHLLEVKSIILDTEVLGRSQRKIEKNGYYYIDLEKSNFIEVTSLEKVYCEKPKSLESKKSGIDFKFKFYNNEEIITKDTLIKNDILKKISFLIKDGSYKGCQIEAIFSSEKIGPFLTPSLDCIFNRNAIYIQCKLPRDQGYIIRRTSFIQLEKDNQIKEVSFLLKHTK